MVLDTLFSLFLLLLLLLSYTDVVSVTIFYSLGGGGLCVFDKQGLFLFNCTGWIIPSLPSSLFFLFVCFPVPQQQQQQQQFEVENKNIFCTQQILFEFWSELCVECVSFLDGLGE